MNIATGGRWLAVILALAAALAIASPAAAYETTYVEGTTNYLELRGSTTKGSTTTFYVLDVGVFEGEGFYVCLIARTERNGVARPGANGCYIEQTQTRITGTSALDFTVLPTTLTLSNGKRYTVEASAHATQTPNHIVSGCADIYGGPVAGTIQVKRTTVEATGIASRNTYTNC